MFGFREQSTTRIMSVTPPTPQFAGKRPLLIRTDLIRGAVMAEPTTCERRNYCLRRLIRYNPSHTIARALVYSVEDGVTSDKEQI